ncbi:MAG: alpha/beta fold hydrolase [Gammaproteobacteria bacterium]
MISSRLVATRHGDMHIRSTERAGFQTAPNPPLLCLHPCPFSGLYFTTIMPLIADRGLALAPDYPGYGHSYIPQTTPAPSIRDYAAALLELLDVLDLETPIDALGFHTGGLVGLELAVLAPHRFRRLLLIDVPCHDEAQRLELMTAPIAQPFPVDNPSALAAARRQHTQTREGAMSPSRINELFAEHERVLPRAHWGFRAAYSYDWQARAIALRTPTRLIATRSTLLDPTRAAAAALPGAALIERLDIRRAVFEEGAPVIAGELRQWLDS